MRIQLASLARDIAVAVLAIAGACHIDLAAAPPVAPARELDVAPRIFARDLDVAAPGPCALLARDVDVAAARLVLDNPRGAP